VIGARRATRDVALEGSPPTRTPVVAPVRARRAGRPSEQLTVWGYIYAAPLVLLVAGFVAYPLASVVFHSFTRWDGISPAKWVGLHNYRYLINDPVFRISIRNNAIFALAVPLWTGVPLLVAALLHERVWGWRFFRSTIFLPSVLSTVVVGILWSSALGYDGGINAFLRGVGLGALAHEWLLNPWYSMPAIILVVLWANVGYNTLIFLAGMAAIDPELTDAARIDGAGWWSVLWHITIPGLRRVIELVTVLNVIGAFAYMFTYIYVITGGGPGFDTYVTEYYVYQRAFNFGNMGYACAVGVTLMAIIAVVSVLEVRILARAARA
jgi:ABC-type sugar transport system permease subunit